MGHREIRPPRVVTPSQGETPRPDPTEAVRKACDALLLTSPVASFPEGKGAAAGYDLVGTCADYLANEIVKQTPRTRRRKTGHTFRFASATRS